MEENTDVDVSSDEEYVPGTFPVIGGHEELQDEEIESECMVGQDGGSQVEGSAGTKTSGAKRYREEAKGFFSNEGLKVDIKRKWFTKRLGTVELWDLPKIKNVKISHDEWHKYVDFYLSPKGKKYAEEQRQRGLIHNCWALVQEGVEDLSSKNVYLLARTHEDGTIKCPVAKEIKKSIDDISQKVESKEIKLGPREDILQRALDKPAASGRVITRGPAARYGTHFGKRKKSRAEAKVELLQPQIEMLNKQIKGKNSKGSSSTQREQDNRKQESEQSNPFEEDSVYRPDMTNVNQRDSNDHDVYEKSKSSGHLACQSNSHNSLNRTDNMINVCTSNVSTAHAQRSKSNPRINALEDSPRCNVGYSPYCNGAPCGSDNNAKPVHNIPSTSRHSPFISLEGSQQTRKKEKANSRKSTHMPIEKQVPQPLGTPLGSTKQSMLGGFPSIDFGSEFLSELQSILLLSSLLKRIDRLLQFDSYNGILTTSCIQTLTQIALKLSGFICLDHVFDLIKPFRNLKTLWQVRIEASKALLSIELHCKGIDARQVKLGVHAMRLCQIRADSDSKDDIKNETLLALLRLLEGRIVFNNEFLRHHLFCIFQILAGRNPTLYGVPEDIKLLVADTDIFSEQRSIYGPPPIMTDMKPPKPAGDIANFPHGMDLSNFSHNGVGLVGIIAPME
ncbi:hypothetical protein ACFE04_023733 [Oxalis oulophora]